MKFRLHRRGSEGPEYVYRMFFLYLSIASAAAALLLLIVFLLFK